MGRPTASLQVKSASLAFVRMITRVTGDTLDMLARCGCCSVFSVLREVAPSLARLGDSGNRDGISEVELNKLLQVHMHFIQNAFILPSSWRNEVNVLEHENSCQSRKCKICEQISSLVQKNIICSFDIDLFELLCSPLVSHVFGIEKSVLPIARRILSEQVSTYLVVSSG